MNIQEYNRAVDNFSDGVFRFVLKNLRHRENARDIVQDSFEKLWMNKENISFQKVKSYLFTTAYHTMIDHIRKHKRIADFDESMLNRTTERHGYSDVEEVLEQALTRLPEDQRSVLVLRDYEGYSYEEIGQITGLSEAQVKVYIYRARVFLKNYIGSMSVLI